MKYQTWWGDSLSTELEANMLKSVDLRVGQFVKTGWEWRFDTTGLAAWLKRDVNLQEMPVK